jgi:FkbH-like protein
MFELAWKNKALAQKEEAITPSFHEEMPEINAAGFLRWEEHCVECAPPDCFDNCPLLVRRPDRKCARFVYGILPNAQFHGAENFGAEIKFRRWAKLETKWPKNPRTYSLSGLRHLSYAINGLELLVSNISSAIAFISPRRRLNGALALLLGKSFGALANSKAKDGCLEGFLIEFYCPEDLNDAFFFEIVDGITPRFRTRLPITKGWNRDFIDCKNLPQCLKEKSFGRLWVEGDREIRIVFTWLHLIKFKNYEEALRKIAPLKASDKKEKTPADKLKCVVFDLDNTLWDGIIGDQGPDGVKVKSETVEFIYQLDRRGIICSVASKNDFQIAWKKIEEIGLGQHLLFPQINWGAKGDSMKEIADLMNVNIDSLALIDDNPFEREQVNTRWPQVRTYDVANLGSLLDRPEFDVPITEQAGKRRLSYLAESNRAKSMQHSGQDIDTFLRSCDMTMWIGPAKEHFDRCHELVMRTNQFNISGNKYSADEFDRLIDSSICVCWKVHDRFGDYGVVGFARLEEQPDAYLITDFVMSCRVAEKRVEESLFAWFKRNLNKQKPLRFRFVQTERNGPILKKFESLGLTIQAEVDGASIYELSGSADDIDPNVIHVEGRIAG